MLDNNMIVKELNFADYNWRKLPFPRYERKGECLRCGWCCLHEDPPCLHLEIDESGKATCLIFDSPDRPSKCHNHPGNPPILHEGCGYWFIDKWDSDKVIKYGSKM